LENITEERLNYSEPGQAGRKVITMTNGYHHEVDARSKKDRKDENQASKAKTTVARTDKQPVAKTVSPVNRVIENGGS